MRGMPNSNVDVIRSCYERHNRGDQRGWLEVFDDEMVFSTQGVRFMRETRLVGKESVVAWFIDYFEAFREYEFLVEDITDVGHGWVLAIAPVRGVGHHSGIEFGHLGVACYRFAGDKIVEFHTFGDREAALSMLREVGAEDSASG